MSRLPLILLFSLACGDPDPSDTGAAGPPPGGDIVFTDAANYSYTAEMAVQSFDIPEYTDVLVRWDALTTDIRERPIADPSAIEQIALVNFGLSQQEILDAIASNSLAQSDIRDYRLVMNDDGMTQAWLSDFSILGNNFDPATDMHAPETDATWAITLWATADGRQDILSVLFLNPTESGSLTEVAFTDDVATLDFQADLHSAPPLETSAGLSYTLDWTDLESDATGNAFNPLLGNRLIIGRVDTDGPEGVEAIFMQLNESADALYRLDVYGVTTADLSLATDNAGAAFPGFTTDGTWMIGVECTTCTSPAPLALSVVDVWPAQ